MRKQNGEHYKEYSVKTVWNTAAKILQRKYAEEYGVIFNPFDDIRFKKAREARDTLRKMLRRNPQKRKVSTEILTVNDLKRITDTCNEGTPDGLQKKFIHIASYELAWRGRETSECMVYFFQEEIDNHGNLSNRLIYNINFTKTNQDDIKDYTGNKFLYENLADSSLCPIRLFRKLLRKRTQNINTDRMFLTPNQFWNQNSYSSWYKNTPVGKNELAKWKRQAIENIGLDSKKKWTGKNVKRSSVGHQHQIMPVDKLVNITKPILPQLKPDIQQRSSNFKIVVGSLPSENPNTETTIVQHIKTEDQAWYLPENVNIKDEQTWSYEEFTEQKN